MSKSKKSQTYANIRSYNENKLIHSKNGTWIKDEIKFIRLNGQLFISIRIKKFRRIIIDDGANGNWLKHIRANASSKRST